MPGNEPSQILKRYLIGLLVPQSAADAAVELGKAFVSSGGMPAPMPPLVPLAEFASMPRPPVPGLLPPAINPLIISDEPEISDEEAGSWVLWPVESGQWFRDLAQELGEASELPETNGTLFPLLRGIPLAVWEEECPIVVSSIRYPYKNGWRALNLVCWEIHYSPDVPWYRAAMWTVKWKRRLKRAPSLTNNDKYPNLA